MIPGLGRKRRSVDDVIIDDEIDGQTDKKSEPNADGNADGQLKTKQEADSTSDESDLHKKSVEDIWDKELTGEEVEARFKRQVIHTY